MAASRHEVAEVRGTRGQSFLDDIDRREEFRVVAAEPPVNLLFLKYPRIYGRLKERLAREGEERLSESGQDLAEMKSRCDRLEARLEDANQYLLLKLSEALRDEEAIEILKVLKEVIKTDLEKLGLSEDVRRIAVALARLMAAGLCELSDHQVWITEQGRKASSGRQSFVS